MADLDAETRALLTLHLVPGLGPRLTRALVEHFGSAEAVLRASAEQLAQVPRLPKKLADALASAIVQAPLESELADIASVAARLVGWHAPHYPQSLRELPDAPPLLYMRGQLQPDEPCVAVVGSRLCTNYGRRITERLVAGLVQAGYTIVSGLARGIDGIAHETALARGGRTVAVFAGGLLCVYPPEHRDLAERIVARGALLSEQPMRVPPERQMFPARNRLISGLCQGVVIVEASDRSGALITARHAVEQGREVFVVPGPVDSPTAGGIVSLLRQGAYPVQDANEIVEILRQRSVNARQPDPRVPSSAGSLEPVDQVAPGRTGQATFADSETSRRQQADSRALDISPPRRGSPAALLPKQNGRGEDSSGQNRSVLPDGLPDYVRQLYQALTSEPQDADQLAEQTGLSAQELGRAVVQLELLGLLRRWPGNRLTRSP